MIRSMWGDPVTFVLTIPAVLWAISFHEFCHGYVAKLVGDPTAEREGRLSLNPLAHFDPVGTLMLLFFGFGWARPVPINTRYFRHPKRDIALVSLAGVTGNFLTVVVCFIVFRIFITFFMGAGEGAPQIALMQMIRINMGLAAFNLIPIPPLDGSKLIYSFIPFRFLRYYYWLEQYGTIILVVLLVSRGIDFLFGPIINLLFRLLFFIVGGLF